MITSDQFKNKMINSKNILEEFRNKYKADEIKDHYNEIEGVYPLPPNDNFPYLEDFMKKFRDTDNFEDLSKLYDISNSELNDTEIDIISEFIKVSIVYFEIREPFKNQVIRKLKYMSTLLSGK
jgi:hypothetical protein